MNRPTSIFWSAVALTLALPFTAAADSRSEVVSPQELHRRIVSESRLRQERIARLQSFFSSETGRKALSSSKLHAEKIVRAAPLLSDEELAELTARADRAEADFKAGALTNQQLTYIVIALGTAVLILVILAA
ncbi:MAG: hypothetical protein WD696_14685 [Bryobacteraceae bacterium]